MLSEMPLTVPDIDAVVSLMNTRSPGALAADETPPMLQVSDSDPLSCAETLTLANTGLTGTFGMSGCRMAAIEITRLPPTSTPTPALILRSPSDFAELIF